MANRREKKARPEKSPVQPSSNDQSGSTGRATGGKDSGHGDTGQGRYGQTGFAGQPGETQGQARYRKSGPDGTSDPDPDSNEGSSHSDPGNKP